MKTYKAVAGSCLSDKDAKVIGRRLDELGDTTPETIVDDARQASSPLHRFFEWDAAKAHRAYLLQRARHLVVSIAVVVTGEQTVRAFHSVQVQHFEGGPKSRIYVSTDKVAIDKDLQRQVLKRALDEAEAWQRRYANLEKSLKTIFQAIKKTRKRLTLRSVARST